MFRRRHHHRAPRILQKAKQAILVYCETLRQEAFGDKHPNWRSFGDPK